GALRPPSTGGRLQSEWVAGLRRNQWPDWLGLRSPAPSTAYLAGKAAHRTGSWGLFLAVKKCPWLVRPALQIALLPVPLRMDAQKLLSIELEPVRPPEPAPHRHRLGRIRRGHLSIDRPGRIVRHVPHPIGVADIGLGISIVMRTDRPR